MAGSATTPPDPPVIGINGDSSGNDLIRVESSVTFNWVPDSGRPYTEHQASVGYNPDGTQYTTDTSTSGLSHASGSMTFTGVSSSAPFQAAANTLDFQFDGGWPYYGPQGSQGGAYSWDPAAGALTGSTTAEWDDAIFAEFDSNAASLNAFHWSGNTSIQEYGRWVLAPDPHNVEVFGGAGNDAIYGGQGNQILSGDDGNDLLYAGIGADTLLGGAGNDVLHGGTGTQLLDGGTGDDTITGGNGDQTLLGSDGRNLLQAGTGRQTVLGGAGDDTIRGGTGAQLLMGGGGLDHIEAGHGNQTLIGGAGRDVFTIGAGSGGPIVIGDFTPGQDQIAIGRGFNGLALHTPRDLLQLLSSEVRDDAVLHLGGGATVTLSHISAQAVEGHVQGWFKIA